MAKTPSTTEKSAKGLAGKTESGAKGAAQGAAPGSAAKMAASAAVGKDGKPSATTPGSGELPPQENPETETPTDAENAPSRPPSRLFKALSSLAYFLLLGSFGGVLVATLFALDFLDILQFRYKVPESMRKRWPLEKYYEFVRQNQMPSEQRYEELMAREKQRYNDLVSEGSSDLKKRATELETSYRDLIRQQEMAYQTALASQTFHQTTLIASQEAAYRQLMLAQEDTFRKRQQELLGIQEENLKERMRLEELKRDLDTRKESVDILSKQVAAEAVNLESSLIRFMEEDNRLKPIQEVAATMNPRALAQIFDEVSDNKLIYDILRGIPPERSALILSFMDPEKAGKIVKMSTAPQTLPTGNRPYIPSSLQGIVASAQSNLR
ncbi:MAG: hypothetical protein WA705_26870 [Candidatus Ozemobacteraceae bacterium]